MGGLRLRHTIAQGGPEGNRSAWSDNSAPVALNPGDGGTGVLVYVAPLWSPYDNTGDNPDGPPAAAIQTLLGIYVVADKAVDAGDVNSDISFSLYRDGVEVGGGRVAGWDSGDNPAFPLGVPVLVPFDPTNTALLPVPSPAGARPVSATEALLPLNPGDTVLGTAGTVADLDNLLALVNAQ